MTIPAQMRLHGFIATDPDPHFSENGVARCSARVGAPHLRQNSNGSSTELEPTFQDLVILRPATERAYTGFRRADTFVAWGYINENLCERHGRTVVHEEFLARHFGHNLVMTKYVVERKQPAPPDPGVSIATPTDRFLSLSSGSDLVPRHAPA